MKASKKTLGLISGGLSLVLIGSISFAALSLLYKEDTYKPVDPKPDGRGKNYEHYKISSYVNSNENLKHIMSTYIENNKYVREINTTKFPANIETLIKDVIGSISRFKKSIDKYKFEVRYTIYEDKKTALIDTVWYIPSSTSSQYYYYDQFELDISNS